MNRRHHHRARHFLATLRNLTIVALAVAAIALSLAVAGPALDDLDAARATAANLRQAEKDAQRQARFAAGMTKACGPNAYAALQADGISVQCYTKHGYKAALTARVQL